jgi:hypothetical protein
MPQPVHGNIQTVLEIDVRAVTPDLVAKLLARNELARMRQEGPKDLKRLSGKTNANAPFEKLADLPIDFEWAEDKPVPALWLCRHQLFLRSVETIIMPDCDGLPGAPQRLQQFSR